MKQYILKINRRFIYVFIMVLIIVFSLFFLNYYFDISASAFTVKISDSKSFENKITDQPENIDDMNENFENYFNK